MGPGLSFRHRFSVKKREKWACYKLKSGRGPQRSQRLEVRPDAVPCREPYGEMVGVCEGLGPFQELLRVEMA